MRQLNSVFSAQENTRPEGGPTGKASYRFSIVIPALNEQHVIGHCLDSVACVEFPSQQFEVIVVDNGSTDQTREIAESYHGVLNIKVLVLPGANIAALRNAGAPEAAGKYLVFLDADIVVVPSWLRNAEKILTSSDLQVIGGFYGVPDNSSWVARVWFSRKLKERDLSPSYLPSGNLVVSRDAFLRIGGFDESLKTSEDCDFCCRARSLGVKMAQYDSISTVHLGSPQTIRAFFRREVWHGTSVFRVFLRNLDRFQNVRPVLFAAYTLCCFVVIIVGAILAFYGNLLTLLLSITMLPLGPMILAVVAARRRQWRQFPAFFVLFLVYGCARAVSLIFVIIGTHISRGSRAANIATALSRMPRPS